MAKQHQWILLVAILSLLSLQTTSFRIPQRESNIGILHNKRIVKERSRHLPFHLQATAVRLSSLVDTLCAHHARAGAALALSTVAGIHVDRLLPSSAILVTLSTAAVLSNANLAPTSHPLYDLSWTTFLPASLALLLLSLEEKSSKSLSQEDYVASSVKRLAIPFTWASTGSILGSILAFDISCRFPAFGLSPSDASIAAACLAASFIGGSVNFFATAGLIAGPKATTLVSSMATADLVVMALYFACIGTAVQSSKLKTWFGDPPCATTLEVGTLNTTESDQTRERPNLWRTTRATVLASMTALAIVKVARRIEKCLEGIVPGTACAVIAAVVPLVVRNLPLNDPLWQDAKRMAAPLSEINFLLLFATIGMSADLTSALRSGPTCLVFSLIALIVHLLVTVAGSWFFRRWGPCRSIRWADVLVASNAAIGGPATAAAFCGKISGPKRDLTVAASVWGVFGYAIGTTVGVTLFRCLQRVL